VIDTMVDKVEEAVDGFDGPVRHFSRFNRSKNEKRDFAGSLVGPEYLCKPFG
jgi:hypothetical protein